MSSKGYILPIVIILSGIASSILAYDLHRFRAQTQLQSLESQKKAMLLVLESESMVFLKQLEEQLNRNCESLEHHNSDTACELPSLFLPSEIVPLHKSMKVSLAFEPCTEVYGAACADRYQKLFGIAHLSIQGPAPNASLVTQVHYERYGYIQRVKQESAQGVFFQLRRSALVESI